MFNRTYQLRSTKVKAAGGGHRVAEDLSLRLPWAGIFEPWRPFVATAQAAETLGIAKVAARPKKSAVRCRKASRWLQGVQLDLFPDGSSDMTAQKFTAAGKFTADRAQKPGESAAKFEFPPLAGAPLLEATESDKEDDRPLFDLFPEAYE